MTTDGATEIPHLEIALRRSEAHKRIALSQDEIKNWLSVLNLVPRTLEACQRVFEASPDLKGIAFLLQRLKDDYEVATVCAVSGLASAGFDTLRDVMEIEQLLLHFIHNPDDIQRWIEVDEKTRKREFSSSRLRKAEAKRLKVSEESLRYTKDHNSHNRFLHVNPPDELSRLRGVNRYHPVRSQFVFWELFFHGRRTLLTVADFPGVFEQGFLGDFNVSEAISRFMEIYAEIDSRIVAYSKKSETAT